MTGASLVGTLEGERKWVTVLVADMKSSMELLAGRDPEEAERFLDAVLELMMGAVHDYGGTVSQVAGDGIVALFGAPRAHEDHALVACHAALRMQESVKRYAREAAPTAEAISIRVGVHSGQVVVRTVDNDFYTDYAAVGATTYVASHMEQAAPPGSVLMTADTLRLVEGYVEARPLGALAHSGSSDPVDAYELLAMGPRRARLEVAATRGLTPFVGREEALGDLRAALERGAGGHGQVVVVVGEAGVGKSRLVSELLRDGASDWRVLRGRSLSYGTSTAYLGVVELLRVYVGVTEGDSVGVVRNTISARTLALDPGLEPLVPALVALLGAPAADPRWDLLDPVQRRERAADAFTTLLLRESARQPLLVVFEDLHWVDRETLECLDLLVQRFAHSRTVLLITSRPEYQSPWRVMPCFTEVRVDPLPAVQVDAMLQALLGTGVDLERVKRDLTEWTEGNPFFLEESVRSLEETGVLVGTPGAYRLARSPGELPVPPSVHAVLAARIDRLAPEDKLLLQTAAVIGRDLRFAALRAVTGRAEPELRDALQRLEAGGFVRATRLFPETEYRFKHAITHDVAYAGLLNDHKRALHGRVLAALESLHAGRLAEVAETLAEHALRAEAWEQAVDHLRTTAGRAYERGALAETLERLERALEVGRRLAPSADNTRRVLDARLDLHAPLLLMGQVARMTALHDETRALVGTLDDPVRLARTLCRISSARWIGARYAEGLEAAREALRIARDDAESRIYATLYLGIHSMFIGRFHDAIAHFRQILEGPDAALSTRRFGASAPAYVVSNYFLVWALASVGEFEQSLAHGRRSVEAADASAAPPYQAPTYALFAVALAYRGEFAQALRYAEEALRIAESRRMLSWLPGASSTLGWVLAWSGQAEAGLPYLERSVALHENLGINALLSLFCRRWAEALHLAGHLDQAAAVARRALDLATQFGEHGVAAEVILTSGEIAERSAPDDVAQADDLYARAASQANALGMRPLLARARLRRGRLWQRVGRGDHGREDLAVATQLLAEMDMRFWLGAGH